MKYRESGMPQEGQWQTFFEPEKILRSLEAGGRLLVDIGCGYGTFLIPAAGMAEKVVGIDIEEDMLQACREKAGRLGLSNVTLIRADAGHGLPRLEADYICLFNILHCENPAALLSASRGLLTESGKIGVIHWKPGETPRGPSLDIRPSPEDIVGWAESAGLKPLKNIDLPPWHFGLLFCRAEAPR